MTPGIPGERHKETQIYRLAPAGNLTMTTG